MTKATPELFHAVRQAGPATKNQVVLWIKNWRARARQHQKRATSEPSGIPAADSESVCRLLREPSLQEAGDLATSGNEERDDGQTISNFGRVHSALLAQLFPALQSVASQDAENLKTKIKTSTRIFFFGVDKEGSVLQAFESNLNSLGFNTLSPP